MALTNNNLRVIEAIAKNDIHSARKAAMASLMEDNSNKNAWARDYYKKLLVSNAGTIMNSLPNDMQSILVAEVPSGFNESRYYLRDSEKVIVDDVIKMKKISDVLSLKQISYKNTTLLYGESGTGKTELSKYIAYKLNLPFFYISFASTIDSYMGSTAKNIHKIFEFCSSIPCVLMLDEIDCVAMKRTSGGSKGADGELERTTISIMQELDKIPNHVVIIAATNRLDIVDDALLRRFSIKHEVKNMNSKELKELAKAFLKSTKTESYISDITIQNLALTYNNPGQLMPELIKKIGLALYEENKDNIVEETNENINVFEVTYTETTNISAETEEDAIALFRYNRNKYNYDSKDSKYSAKRVDYI